MELWNEWLTLVNYFQNACSRKQTFFWLVTVLIGFTVKFNFLGVTSLARGVGLLSSYYTCLSQLLSVFYFFKVTQSNES